MSDDPTLKSAYELAMERLRAKDREEGIEETGPLDDEQKKEIARLRDDATAKLAEIEILHKQNAAKTADPVEMAKLEENYRTDRARIDDRLQSAIAKVRRRS